MTTKLQDQFNLLALTFLRRMKETFPKEKKIQLYISKYELAMDINPLYPVKTFMDSMREYGEQILTKDEHFFKQDELVDNAQSISGQIGLVDYWDTTPQVTKDSIWEYIQGLYVLGMGALGLNEELSALIAKTKFTGS